MAREIALQQKTDVFDHAELPEHARNAALHMFDRAAEAVPDRLDQILQPVRLRQHDGVVPAEQRAGVGSVRIAEADYRKCIPSGPFLVIAGDLKVVGTPLMFVEAADQLQRIEPPAVQDRGGDPLVDHIGFGLPVGMAEHRQPSPFADAVEHPLARRHREPVAHLRPQRFCDRRDLPPVTLLFTASQFIHAERAAEIDDMHRIVRGVHLLAGKQLQVGRQFAPDPDRLQRRRVTVMVGHGDEIEAFLAVAGGDVLRRLASVRTPAVHVEIPLERTALIQIGAERIDVETQRFTRPERPLVRLAVAGFGQFQRQVVLLLPGEIRPDAQCAVGIQLPAAQRLRPAFAHAVVERNHPDFDPVRRREFRVGEARPDRDRALPVCRNHSRSHIVIIPVFVHFPFPSILKLRLRIVYSRKKRKQPE